MRDRRLGPISLPRSRPPEYCHLGRRWEKAVRKGRFFPDLDVVFPPFPTISHIDFLTTDGHRWTRIVNWRKHWRRPLLRSEAMEGRADLRGKKCGLLRIVARCYAKVHESSHRSGPWLRDVTHCY